MSAVLDEDGRLRGALSFDDMADLRGAGESLIAAAEGPEVVIDLSGLREASTLAVSLLVAWLRAAQGCGKSLVLRGASPGLRDIAAFSGLEEILPLQPGADANAG